MCTLFLALNAHPQYPFVIAANRDEYYARPTAELSVWGDIVGGRDLKQGGYWLAVNRAAGTFAALTNVRGCGQKPRQAISRGHLVRDYLEADIAVEDYIRQVSARADQYEGFNLLLGNLGGEVACYSNVSGRIQWCQPGIYGLSNGQLDEAWPKVEAGKAAFAQALESAEVDEAALFQLLSNRHIYADKELPVTGVPLNVERLLSALFIASPTYGTRSSAVIRMQANGQLDVAERRYGPMGQQLGVRGSEIRSHIARPPVSGTLVR